MTATATYADTLLALARADERLIVMTAENRAPIRSLPAALGDRFLDTGITEQTMVGMAAGLALRGRIPVVHALATFLTMRAFEFIRTDVGIPALPVKLVGTVPGILSEANGPTHQSLEDIALMRGIPNVNVFCPADVGDLIAGLEVVVNDPSPWYIRYCDRPAVTQHAPLEIGTAEVFAATEEDDVAIIVAGALFREVWDAAALLRNDGLRVRIVNLRTVKPADEAAILDAAKAALAVVTIEDHFETGGVWSIVADVIARASISTQTLSISCGDSWFAPALLPDALHTAGFTAEAIAARISTELSTLTSF
ncbi:MAG TPA: transketolase C-terminal domain-containing protein [Gemmatimonadaceae bacterium]|nr:transketolase C-terminal domain-containing protein [Gemmatimonadaceae bacterium]